MQIKKYLEEKDIDSLCEFLLNVPMGPIKDESIKSSCAAMRDEENIDLLVPFALKAIEYKLTTNTQHFNSLLHAFAESSRVSEFAEFIEFLALKRVKFQDLFFMKCAKKFNTRNIIEFPNLISMMVSLNKEGVYVPKQVYTHAINVCYQSNNWEGALILYESIEASLDVDNLLDTYEKVVKTLLNCDRKDEAIKIMRTIASTYGMKCHGQLICLMISAGDVDGAVRMAKHAHQINAVLGYESYLLMGNALSEGNCMYKFDDLINDMIFRADGGVYAYTKAMHIYRDMGFYEKADETFSNMISCGIDPSRRSMEVLLGVDITLDSDFSNCFQDTIMNDSSNGEGIDGNEEEKGRGGEDKTMMIIRHMERLEENGEFNSFEKLVSAVSILEAHNINRFGYALSLCKSNILICALCLGLPTEDVRIEGIDGSSIVVIMILMSLHETM